MIGDPASVAAASGRPVRFLAKAPLFANPLAGSVLRALGAIPVFRRNDDPALVHLNDAMFDEVQSALGAGSAIGVFPEGISHGGPAVAQLRTGAARIALGAALLTSDPILIIPIGLLYSRKKEFRSKATAFVGREVQWDDLRGREEGDEAAVRELTARIDSALRSVTVNLEQWEDAPAIRMAEAIYSSELGLKRDSAARLERIHETTLALADHRREGTEGTEQLVRELADFSRLLSALQLRPGDLEFRPRPVLVARWILKRAVWLMVALPTLFVGAVIFFVPYQLTRLLDRLLRVDDVERATVKILGGALFYFLWMGILVVSAGVVINLRAALFCAAILPLLGLATLWLAERGVESFVQARRFLILTRRRPLREGLLSRRRELFQSLEKLRSLL